MKINEQTIVTEKDKHLGLYGTQIFWIQGHMNYLSDMQIVGKFHESKKNHVMRVLNNLRSGKIICH